MFADDTNLFFTHKDIRYLFQIVNKEFENINLWFISNKLSLNIKKIKYSFFHKPKRKKESNQKSQKENIPLLLPKLRVLLGVLLDENLSWKERIKYNEYKTAKNLGLLYKAKHYLNKRSILVLYYSFIRTCINYGNIVWGSTNRTNLSKNQQSRKSCHPDHTL